jgi:hypothetical protein
LWDNASLITVQARWEDRIRNHPALEYAPLMVEEQEQRRSTQGFASITAPWAEVEQQLLSPFFGPGVPQSVDMDAWRSAKVRVENLLDGRRSPLPLEIAQDRAPKNTSSGLPLWSTEPEVLPQYLKRAQYIAQSYDASEFYPFVAGRRTTSAALGEQSKQRLLWIVDKAEVPLGKSAGDVVLEDLRIRHNHFAAWVGPNAVAEHVTVMLHRDLPIHSVDFSRYDASISNLFIQTAFELLMTWVKAPYLEVVGEHFMDGGLLHPYGIAYGKQRGVPSGSSLTNMIDTLVQCLVWNYVAIVLDTQLVDFMVLGDDGLVQFLPERPPDDLEPVFSELGMVFNADKTHYSSEYAHYLQDLYTLQFTKSEVARPLRSSFRMLSRVKRPERLPASDSPATITVSSALKLDKCWGLPYFNELVQFFWEGDKLVRLRPLKELLREAGGAEEIKRVLKFSSFAGSDRDPSLIEALPITAELETIRRRQ